MQGFGETQESILDIDFLIGWKMYLKQLKAIKNIGCEKQTGMVINIKWIERNRVNG